MRNEIDQDAMIRTVNPEGWTAQSIRIGRVVLSGVTVNSRESMTALSDALRLILDKTQRTRKRYGETRYPEPLPSATPGRYLSLEIEDHLDDLRRRNLRPSSISAQERALRMLKLACGDIPVGDITTSHIRDFWDVLRWFPATLGKSSIYRHMTDAELLEHGKKINVAPPATVTMETYRRHAQTFFNRLLKMRVISHSPMEAFSPARDEMVEDETGRPFTDVELGKIFSRDVFLPWAEKAPHRWWLPMMGLFTGARVNELAQLKVADIVQVDDIWCIAIRKTVDIDRKSEKLGRTRQLVKNKSSIRTIPIAQPLLDAGFLDFWEDARATGHPRLFPQLRAGTNRKTGQFNGAGYGVAVTAQFGRYLDKHCPTELGVGFHAFRHYFVSELCDVGYSPELVATLTGHSAKPSAVPTIDRHYRHAKPGKITAQQLEALAELKPPVVLPVYRKGQFKGLTGRFGKMWP
jgi:integrase